ncbi:MAG: energy-coupled thiamine transporter ThiT [Clostridia bacterium]|nr:energy-coupled thiamine transporter ThiT [Clostridia bacterium]
MKQTKRTRCLVEAALLVALATVLSVLKVAELPYGGSITLASMLPIVLLAYRNGILWGLGGGFVYAALQQLLGLNNLSYFTTWQSIVAIILLDYILAFTVVGLGGIFRRTVKNQALSLAAGSLLVCVLRYVCHVISGATVWAGLSIPSAAALSYSFIYNATYMLPEAIVLIAVAYYLGTLLDFRKEQPVRLVRDHTAPAEVNLLGVIAGLFALIGVAVDVALIFPQLQNAESGEFDVTGLKVELFADSFWLPVVIVTAVCALICAALLYARYRLKTAAQNEAAEQKENA